MKKTFKSKYALLAISSVIFLSACAPSFPNNSDHKDKKPEDCFECHINIKDEHIPENHLDDNGKLLEARNNCLKCHKIKS